VSLGDVHAATLPHIDQPFVGKNAVRSENYPVVHSEFRSQLTTAREAVSTAQRSRFEASKDSTAKDFY
jgi:hypothetical protein